MKLNGCLVLVIGSIAAFGVYIFGGNNMSSIDFNEIEMSWCQYFEQKGGSTVWSEDGNVIHLILTDTNVNDEDSENLIYFSQLATIDLDGTRVTDKTVAHLCKLRKLEVISIRRTGFTEKGIEQLSRCHPKVRVE